ncbi:MAG: hypothetical protein HKN49_04505 [Gammaproteobacteria bacterium]|nr:hypothetical protein [Gammaproteobacteria bacterium]
MMIFSGDSHAGQVMPPRPAVERDFLPLVLILVLFAGPAQATMGMPNLEGLFDGLLYLGLGVLGVTLSTSLLIAHASPGRKRAPVLVWVQLVLFLLLAIKWFFYPKLDLATALIIGASLAFTLVVIYFPPANKSAHFNAFMVLLVSAVILLLNPVILSYGNYVFSDVQPFETDLHTTEVTHPVFSDSRLVSRFLQTSDGVLYYGTRNANWIVGDLKREKAESCDNACPFCDKDCYRFYGIEIEPGRFAQPRAIFDFQDNNNFPQGFESEPLALINLPLTDIVINPNRKTLKATLRRVSDSDGEMIWNPVSNWLWWEVCGGGISNESAQVLIGAGADLNYRADPKRDTTFGCAVRSRDIDQIRMFANNGANPNVELRSNRTYIAHPNAMFLAMHRYWGLDKKEEVFRILVDIGVDVNAQYSDGETLLHRLVSHYYLQERTGLAQLLLSFGVDKNITADNGLTPLALARARIEKLTADQNRDDREEQDLSDLQEIVTILEGKGSPR